MFPTIYRVCILKWIERTQKEVIRIVKWKKSKWRGLQWSGGQRIGLVTGRSAIIIPPGQWFSKFFFFTSRGWFWTLKSTWGHEHAHAQRRKIFILFSSHWQIMWEEVSCARLHNRHCGCNKLLCQLKMQWPVNHLMALPKLSCLSLRKWPLLAVSTLGKNILVGL